MKRSIANAISKKNRDRKYKYFKERVGFTADTKVLDVGLPTMNFHRSIIIWKNTIRFERR